MSVDNFDVKVVDAMQIRISFGGVQISRGAGASGYGDDVFLSVKQKTDSFIEGEGTDGTVWRSKTYSRLCECELTLLQTSASNDYLSSMLVTDEQAQNGAGIASFVVEDLNGTTKFVAQKAYVKKFPDQDWGKGAKERKWMIIAIRSSENVGSN